MNDLVGALTEANPAEDELRERAIRLRLAFAAGQLGEWELDVETDTSVRALRHDQIFGYDAPVENWGFETFISHVPPEDRPQVEERFRAAAATGGGWHFECRIRRANDGAVRWIAVTGEPMRDAQGRVVKIFGLVGDITERKQTEEALRESQRRLNAVLNNATVAIILLDERQRCSYMNAAAEKLTGYTLAEVQGQIMHDVVHHTRPDGRHFPLEECPIDRAFPENNQTQGEEIFVHKDGTFYPVAFTASPVHDDEAKTVGTILEVRDIAAERKAEAALREREADLSEALEAGSLAIFDYDEKTRDLRPSPRLNEMYGYPPGQPLTIEDIRARYHPEDVEEIAARVRRRNENPTIRQFDWTTRLLLPDGSVRWVNGRGEYIRDEAGHILRSRGVVMDITERKQAEEANARLAAIVSSSPDAIISFDAADKRISSWNRGAQTLFGYTEAEALGATAGLLVSPEHLTEVENQTGVFDHVMANGDARIETLRRRKDGVLVNVAVSATRMMDTSGRVLGVSAIFRETTEQKRWEEHQRLLINELNHRVKNTLATVQSIASQTLRNSGTAAEAREALESRLFALSRAHDVLTSENWEGANLQDIAAQALAPYANSGEDRLHLSGPPVRLLPRMALALAMALQELATNAVKYGALSNEAGQVHIAWRNDDGRLHLTWTETGGPEVKAPTRRGFGTRLIERSLVQDLGGTARIDFPVTGVVCTVDAQLA